MRQLLMMFTLISFLFGCAGVKLPFSDSDHRYARKMITTSHDEHNTDCINLVQLKQVGAILEAQHIGFLKSHNPTDALTREEVEVALGTHCQSQTKSLNTDEVRFWLFGNLQNIPNPDQLKYLGGVLFEYEDTETDSGLRPTFHLEQVETGPVRGIVAIYNLENGQVIHFNAFGADDVDKHTLEWPLVEFFGFVAKGAVQ